MSKLLTVLGATGNQGGSVIRSVLSHPVLSTQFRIRAITRDPSKPSSLALQSRGVEIVKADLNDKQSLTSAISGSHSVFAVTNFWESVSKSTEVQQGRNIADVSKETGVEHLIWSTLPHVTKLSEGKLPNVAHFDGKAEVDEYIRQLGVPMTSFMAGCYMSNLPGMMSKGEDGTYTISLPFPASTSIPFFATADDTGKFVSSILLRREEMLGQRVFGVSGWWTGQEVVEIFQKVTGKKAVYNEVPGDVWKSFLPEAVAQELLENFWLIRDYKYFGPEWEEGVRKSVEMLEEKPVGLEEFLEKGAW
ncbi:hscarg protein [Trichophaea hybrida]|nr:hscarg protein [Trichophaea hybrida]